MTDSPPPVAALVASMLDPPNRYYRYPLAERMVSWVADTRVTPNQITAVHTLFGIAAALAVWRGTGAALLLAGLLWELHLVLDCLDGVLARARHSTTQDGRFLDIMGDAIAYLALAAAMFGYVRSTAPGAPAGLVTAGVIASGALPAWAHEFYRRKLTAALTTGTDPVYEELLAKHRVIAAGRAGVVAWFGYVFDWLQILGLQPSTWRELTSRLRANAPPALPGTSAEVRYIVANAHSPRARRAFRAVSLMAGDNAVTIVGIGLLAGQVLMAELAAIVYAAVALPVGIVTCRAFLRGARAG